MKPLFKRLILVLFFLFFSTQAHASAAKWELDPAHSSIYFSVKHIYSTVQGYFEDIKGTMIFSPDDLAGSSFNFEVKTKSINTGNSKRDSHLNSKEFFESKRYPLMTFKSLAIRHVKDNQYMAEGKMTVKDVTQTISVPFIFMGTKTNPFDNKFDVAGFEARITIDRLAYHVGNGKFYNMGVVGKEIDVLITMEVTRKK